MTTSPTVSATDSRTEATAGGQATVMFVDDEPHVLSALRRMLHSRSRQWTLLFAGSGEEALRLAETHALDVVVSDMRMPGMDGAALLAQLQRVQPAAARIVLSGQADRRAILAALPCTQQMLSKPCDADTLIGVVERVLAVREVLHGSTVREVIGGLGSLPKPPEVYQRVVAAISRPDADISDVAAVIEESVAVSAEVLRLVNTAFFGVPRRVGSVAEAVTLLGLDTIQAVVLASSALDPGSMPAGIDAARLQRTALERASLVRRMAAAESVAAPEASLAVLAGLMRDIGLLALAQAMPAQAIAVQQQLVDGVEPEVATALECELVGCSLPAVSAYLLTLWGFPDPVVRAIAGQPAAPDAAGASLAEHLLAAAHRRVLWPDRPLPFAEGGFVDADRAARWELA